MVITIINEGGGNIFSKYLLRFGLLGTLTFLGLFIYFYKTSGKFRKSIIAAFAAATFFFSGLTTARAAGEADAFTPQPQHQSRPSHRSGFFSGRLSNDGSGPGKPDDFGSDSDRDGLPQFPQTESVEKTEERVERIDDHLRQMSEESDSGTESESEDECRARSINNNSPHYSETITFCDGYKAESVNSGIDHQLVKHGHDWGIDNIDLKNTEDANKPSAVGQFEQIRTRLTPANRNQFRINLREFASRPNLEVYSNYPINKGIGRAYLDPETNLFVGIDENGIIRKTYPASEDLINFLRTNCDGENSGNE